MEENKEKINPADTAKRVVELTSNYEADKKELKEIIKEKESVVVEQAEQIRSTNNRISSLEKELEDERRENRILRQVELDKKEVKNQNTFQEEFQRLQNQRNQTNK